MKEHFRFNAEDILFPEKVEALIEIYQKKVANHKASKTVQTPSTSRRNDGDSDEELPAGYYSFKVSPNLLETDKEDVAEENSGTQEESDDQNSFDYLINHTEPFSPQTVEKVPTSGKQTRTDAHDNGPASRVSKRKHNEILEIRSMEESIEDILSETHDERSELEKTKRRKEKKNKKKKKQKQGDDDMSLIDLNSVVVIEEPSLEEGMVDLTNERDEDGHKKKKKKQKHHKEKKHKRNVQPIEL